METVASVLGSIRKGDWMFSIDLMDTNFQIPVHPESLPYLRFCLEGRFYQFCALCFGLSTAPQVFTRIFALISEWVHRRGVRLLSLFGQLAAHCGVAVSSSAASGSGSPVVQGPGYCGQLGKVRPPSVHSCPVSGHADRHIS